MTPPLNAIRHLRAGQDVEVGACGARGGQNGNPLILSFSMTQRFVTCSACLERRRGARGLADFLRVKKGHAIENRLDRARLADGHKGVAR